MATDCDGEEDMVGAKGAGSTGICKVAWVSHRPRVVAPQVSRKMATAAPLTSSIAPMLHLFPKLRHYRGRAYMYIDAGK